EIGQPAAGETWRHRPEDRPLALDGVCIQRRRPDLLRRIAARRAERRLVPRWPADRRRADPRDLRFQPHRRPPDPDGDLSRTRCRRWRVGQWRRATSTTGEPGFRPRKAVIPAIDLCFYRAVYPSNVAP